MPTFEDMVKSLLNAQKKRIDSRTNSGWATYRSDSMLSADALSLQLAESLSPRMMWKIHTHSNTAWLADQVAAASIATNVTTGPAARFECANVAASPRFLDTARTRR
jgi:hypothetical protein